MPTFLHEVEYQVLAHFEWNIHRPELAEDRIDGKHFSIAKRSLEAGGRQDIFLGTRDCQGYVEPCEFGFGAGAYDHLDELSYGLMFHSFNYPDETGNENLQSNFWQAKLQNGVMQFDDPKIQLISKNIRTMKRKTFGLGINLTSVDTEGMIP